MADTSGGGGTEVEVEGDERTSPRGEMDAGRVLALSDGVFAIAATLLVLDLRVPEGVEPADLPHRLHELLPAAGGYALSYLLIGLLWLGHHRMFRGYSQITGRIARLNLMFLGVIGLLPFVTALLARYGERLPTQLYAGTIAVIFLLELAMNRVALREGLVADRAAALVSALRTGAGAVVFGASVGVAAIPVDWAPSAAKYCWLLLIPGRWAGRLVSRRRAAAERAGAERAAANRAAAARPG
jgi:uncharacterized membrane protein